MPCRRRQVDRGIGSSTAVWYVNSESDRAEHILAAEYTVDASDSAVPVGDAAAVAGTGLTGRLRAENGVSEVTCTECSTGRRAAQAPRQSGTRLRALSCRRISRVSIASARRDTHAGDGADVAAFARPARGVQAAEGWLCQACTELLRDSALLRDLNADGDHVPGITYTDITAGHRRDRRPVRLRLCSPGRIRRISWSRTPCGGLRRTSGDRGQVPALPASS